MMTDAEVSAQMSAHLAEVGNEARLRRCDGVPRQFQPAIDMALARRLN
jgi:hypothetical protein